MIPPRAAPHEQAKIFRAASRLIIRKKSSALHSFLNAMDHKWPNDPAIKKVVSICRKAPVQADDLDSLAEAEHWFSRFSYVDKVLDFLARENSSFLLRKKIQLVNLLCQKAISEPVFKAITSWPVPRSKQGPFFLGLGNMLRNQALIKADTLEDWDIFLRHYIRDFGFTADRTCVLVHRRLMKGEQLPAHGLTETGKAGVLLFRQSLLARIQSVVETGDLSKTDLDHPLTIMAIGMATGFSSSPWGHGALWQISLRAFLARFELLKKEILNSPLIQHLKSDPFGLNVRRQFPVQRLDTDNPADNMIDLSLTRGVLGELAGDIGHCCTSQVNNVMNYPHMVAAIIMTGGRDGMKEFIGSALIVRNQIQGEPVWILGALNIREDLLPVYDPECLIRGTIGYAQWLAGHEGVARVLAPYGASQALSRLPRLSRYLKMLCKDGNLHMDLPECLLVYDDLQFQNKVRELVRMPFENSSDQIPRAPRARLPQGTLTRKIINENTRA